MDTIHFLAQLWGFSLVIISLALLANPNRTKELLHFAHDENRLMIKGMLDLAVGIAMVLTYNVWELNWTLILTILGWLLILWGAKLLFFTSLAAKAIGRAKNSDLVSVGLTAVILVGCVLIYFGFTA